MRLDECLMCASGGRGLKTCITQDSYLLSLYAQRPHTTLATETCVRCRPEGALLPPCMRYKHHNTLKALAHTELSSAVVLALLTTLSCINSLTSAGTRLSGSKKRCFSMISAQRTRSCRSGRAASCIARAEAPLRLVRPSATLSAGRRGRQDRDRFTVAKKGSDLCSHLDGDSLGGPRSTCSMLSNPWPVLGHL